MLVDEDMGVGVVGQANSETKSLWVPVLKYAEELVARAQSAGRLAMQLDVRIQRLVVLVLAVAIVDTANEQQRCTSEGVWFAR